MRHKGRKNHRKIRKDEIRRTSSDDIMWIDGAESVESADEGGPLFEVDQTVITMNPFTFDYAIVDLDETPLYYVIKDIRYDTEENTYRYFLEGEDEWFAEEWLEKPEVPSMTTELRPYREHNLAPGKSGVSVLEPEEIEATSKQLDDMARELTVDMLLERLSWAMLQGNTEEVEACKRKLEEATST